MSKTNIKEKLTCWELINLNIIPDTYQVEILHKNGKQFCSFQIGSFDTLVIAMLSKSDKEILKTKKILSIIPKHATGATIDADNVLDEFDYFQIIIDD